MMNVSPRIFQNGLGKDFLKYEVVINFKKV